MERNAIIIMQICKYKYINICIYTFTNLNMHVNFNIYAYIQINYLLEMQVQKVTKETLTIVLPSKWRQEQQGRTSALGPSVF